MKKRSSHGLFLVITLMTVLVASTQVPKVAAPYPTIYIKADGSIDPPTANITSADNITYTFTADITAFIVVERNDTVVDGAHFTVQGAGSGPGIDLSYTNNVTLQNVKVSNFSYGISLVESSYNTIIGNTVSNNTEGIFLYNSSYTTITDNVASNNGGDGIFLTFGHNNTITGNNVSNNPSLGIQLYSCSHNTITGNVASNNGGDGIFLFSSSNNTISGNNITSNADTGINLDSSSDSTISENLISGNWDGIYLSYSSNITISGNNITGNNQGIFLLSSDENAILRNEFYSNPSAGIRLYSSSNNTIQKNTNFSGYGIQYGIELWVYSHSNIVSENKLSSLYRGIALGFSDGNRILNNIVSKSEIVGIEIQQICNNSIIANNVISNSSQYGISIALESEAIRYNEIQGNTLTHNLIGIYMVRLSGNVIYHNNFIDNTQQTSISNSANIWDDGVEGNYWSNYAGVDWNDDGIGDPPHVIDANNTDYHPLMGVFHSFTTPLGDDVDVISNSTVEGFQYFASNTTIRLHVTNRTVSQTHGFCRIRIPYDVMSPPFTVTVDGVNPTYWNYALYDDGASRWIYFEYAHSTRDIVVIPEFPSAVILPFLLAFLLLATISYRRKRALKT